MPLTLTDLVQGNIAFTGITADSRQVRPGFLFSALSGTKADGRAYVADALSRGAAVIVTDYQAVLPDTGQAVVVRVDNPRQAHALAAAAFYGRQPDWMVAVTGTNGKTSVANFYRQIMAALGHSSAAIGTLGVVAEGWPLHGGLTTPDAAMLHSILAELAAQKVTHCCMEASSHGLAQYRLDGVDLEAAAFTNLTRDHLDFHGHMDAYWDAKLRLFREVLPVGRVAVVNADSPHGEDVVTIARQRSQSVLTFGMQGADLRLCHAVPSAHGQILDLQVLGQSLRVELPLAGTFQASNVLAALGLVLACGADPRDATASLEQLHGVPGRLQPVARRSNGAAIYVDYAHTPDALDTVLCALRPHATGRLVVVFGCGGDRDPGKREDMGEIASALADQVIVTDDNPRSEDPAHIRAAILQTAPQATEIADRAAAIRQAVAGLQSGDVLVIAGKGHEQGQIVGTHILPFDDAEQARQAVALAEGDGA